MQKHLLADGGTGLARHTGWELVLVGREMLPVVLGSAQLLVRRRRRRGGLC